MPFLRLCLFCAIVGSPFLLTAQPVTRLQTLWKKVAALESEGLTRSAEQTVKEIYQLAKKERLPAEELKSCIYLLQYRNRLQEESDEKNIYWLDTLIRQAAAPVKQVFQSLQAELYWQYLQRNRWKLQQQTALSGEAGTDISTWDIRLLYQQIAAGYRASVDSSVLPLLQRTRLEQYEAAIEKGVHTRTLRPTLYDLLAHRALEYFSQVYAEGQQAGEDYLLTDPAVFAPANAFIRHRFPTPATSSAQLETLQMLQQLLRFHLQDASPDALLDADILRLEFAHRFSVLPDKKERYTAALLQLQASYPAHSASARCQYLRAKMLADEDQPMQAEGGEPGPPLLPAAKLLCDSAIRNFPASEGASEARQLLNNLLQPSLSATAEKVNLPGVPFRVLVRYKNLPQIHARMVAVQPDELQALDRLPEEERWQACLRLKAIRSWQQPLPDPGDYREHRTEIKVDEIPHGLYLLLLSADEGFSLQQNILVRQQVWVSNISYVYDENRYYVLHRLTGEPLENATLQVWENRYDYAHNRYERLKAERYQTDQNGACILPPGREFRNLLLQVTWKDDELFTGDYVYSQVYNSYQQEQPTLSCHLFTDRSIYRPEQTIYFKGIIIRHFPRGQRLPETAAALSTQVQVRDANGQVIARIPVVTNSYGSYNGHFRLPSGLMNGEFSLYDSAANGQLPFSVEAYKRPRFLVELRPPAESYRVNDTIRIQATATAYAGNPLSGARVSYRVIRKARYLPWWGAYRQPRYEKIMPPGSATETVVAAGSTVTDIQGGFGIRFTAVPDPAVTAQAQTVYNYEVNADVTDLNGETRSQQLTVAAGYRALQLEIETVAAASADSALLLKVHSTNFNQQPIDVPVKLRVTALQSPGQFFREQYWEQPDQFVMSRETFHRSFPDDPYAGEHLVRNYPREAMISEQTVSSNRITRIGQQPWKAGWYHVQVYGTDRWGDSLYAEKYLYLGREGMYDAAQPLQWKISRETAAPGDTLRSTVQTAGMGAWLLQRVHYTDSSSPVQQIRLQTGSSLQQQWVIGEKDRGGIAMDILFIHNNRVYQQSRTIQVPWSNKELTVTYRHFRDKTEPGAEETWTVTVRGEKQAAVAEILTALYDASLDQYRPHGWRVPEIWPRQSFLRQWTTANFSVVGSEEHISMPDTPFKPFEKRYDRLLSLYAQVPEVSWVKGMRAEAGAEHSKIAAAAPADKAGETAADSTRISNRLPEPIPPGRFRSQFNETVFFYPALYTDSTGSIVFSARLPEALTQWKLMTLAHTRELAAGYAEQRITTQKKLMVQPNLPRLLREGDRMELPVKIVNMDSTELTGTITLSLQDAATGQPIDGWFKNVFPSQYFTVPAGRQVLVAFPVEIPFRFGSAVQIRLLAKAGKFEDGEENILPVGTNRVLVTASLPLTVKNERTKTVQFPALLASAGSPTLTHHALTVEYSSQPAWYAVQALPWLAGGQLESAEQIFNRCFTHLLASHITRQVPKIRQVFEQWQRSDTQALRSNLQRNQELKAVLLEETPWVAEAADETAQKHAVAQLFDKSMIREQTKNAMEKLRELQLPNGAFSWMKGGPGDRYMTQYILTGIGQLQTIGALRDAEVSVQEGFRQLTEKALRFLDRAVQEDYAQLLKPVSLLNRNNLHPLIVQYLYLRSYFPHLPLYAGSRQAYRYYQQQAARFWRSQGKTRQAMIALVLFRSGDRSKASAILRSLQENALRDPERGMYWKEWNQPAWYWYQAPVESQALMIEAFSEAGTDKETVQELKYWLLRQKQTNRWKSSRATASACYALLLNPEPLQELLSEAPLVNIRLGTTTVSSQQDGGSPGTGYFKKQFTGPDIHADMGNVSLQVQPAPGTQPSLSWGALYWQYFEDMDKVQAASTPLQLEREWFVERNTSTGPLLEKINENSALRPGNRVVVRIKLKVDREMEYLHMKDTRAAGLEPLPLLSGYTYRNGLGFYQTNSDAATHFYFDRLRRGTYVFEYTLLAAHAGNFSGGVTTIQCLYAPEFSSNSQGGRLQIEPAE